MSLPSSIISGVASGAPSSLLPWEGKNGIAYPDWPTLQAADPAIVLGPFPADPGSGESRFLSAALIGQPITTEWYIVNVSAIGLCHDGEVREWAKVVSFNPGTGEVITSKPLNWDTQDAILVYMTAGTMTQPHAENISPSGPADINLGGNVLQGSITLNDSVELGRVAFGKVNEGIQLPGGKTFIFEDLEPFGLDGGAGVESDTNGVGHMTAVNCIFDFNHRWENASFDIFNHKTLKTSTFLSRDGANPPNVTNFRVTGQGGNINGQVFNLANTPASVMGYLSLTWGGVSIGPWFDNALYENRFFTVFYVTEGTALTIAPSILGQVIINAPMFGDLIPLGGDLDHLPGFAYFTVNRDFTGNIDFAGNFINFWQANVPGCQASIVRLQGGGNFGGVIKLNSGSLGIDVGSSGIASLIDHGQDQSGTIDFNGVNICLRAGTLIQNIDALLAFLVVRTAGGINGGGTINFNNTTMFNGGALASFISFGAGPSTALKINITGSVFAENISVNNAAFVGDSTFTAGVVIVISGFTTIDLANYGPSLTTQAVVDNQGLADMTITGQIDMTNFSGINCACIRSSGGGNTRMSGALTLKDIHLTGDFDVVQSQAGVGASAELSGAFALRGGGLIGGGTMNMLNIAAGDVGVGPAVWRFDNIIHLMHFVLATGAGGFAWAGSVVRWRFVYFDFAPDIDGTYIAFFEAYKCHLASNQSLAVGNTAYVQLSGGGDPVGGFFFFDCKLYGPLPGPVGASQPAILDDWVTLKSVVVIPFANTVGVNAAGDAVINAPFPGQKLVGPLSAGGGGGGAGALICTKGRVKVAVGANPIVPGLPLTQSVVAGICHNGAVGAAPDNTVGIPLTPNVGGLCYAIVGCAN